MDGHKDDGIRAFVILVNVADEGYFLEEAGKGALVTCIGNALLILDCGGDKFVYGVYSSLALKALGLEHIVVSRIVEYRLNKLGGAGCFCLYALDKLNECDKLICAF